uniref:Photosystem I reaction center subunit IX n=1 Tax=Botrychium lunaria TaxID=37231 RepID=A0A6H0JQN8_BOTLU|nr:photosystem I subunit IX [Botrychium lunaria]QIU83311.1 photosystem I subunit IX [Botrychium lunaria]
MDVFIRIHPYPCVSVYIPIYPSILYDSSKGELTMQDVKSYLSTAPVLAALWFGSLAGSLIEINRFFPDALVSPTF